MLKKIPFYNVFSYLEITPEALMKKSALNHFQKNRDNVTVDRDPQHPSSPNGRSVRCAGH